MESEQDVTAESSSALGEAIASSPEALEETQGTETVTPEKTVSQEEQAEESRVPYSRLKEVVDEKNFWREKAMQQIPQQQPQQPTQPQELGNTPEEREFWKAVDKRAELIADQKLKQISPVIDAGRQELAGLKVQQFRNAHPDIKPNSPEEMAIAEKISYGYLPEDAYRSVMWDSKVADTEKQVNSNNKAKIEAKKQANVEQRSIPSGGTAPTSAKLSQRERIRQEADKLTW